MRRIRQATLKTCTALARPILAVALLLCVLSSALPAEAVLNPFDSMPCCRGTKGKAGECHGGSCPMHLGELKKSVRVVQHDPVCGAERVLQAIAETPVLPAPDYFGQTDSDEFSPVKVEHQHDGSVSPRNILPRQPHVGIALLSRPCPSDCSGAAAASFASLRRPSHHATLLTDNLRPRPPNVESFSYEPRGLFKLASVLRRSHPPRPPPSAPVSRSI